MCLDTDYGAAIDLPQAMSRITRKPDMLLDQHNEHLPALPIDSRLLDHERRQLETVECADMPTCMHVACSRQAYAKF